MPDLGTLLAIIAAVLGLGGYIGYRHARGREAERKNREYSRRKQHRAARRRGREVRQKEDAKHLMRGHQAIDNLPDHTEIPTQDEVDEFVDNISDFTRWRKNRK